MIVATFAYAGGFSKAWLPRQYVGPYGGLSLNIKFDSTNGNREQRDA
jgi:hypothetical protein